MDRAQLEQLALEKISKMQTAPSSSFDREQLEQMALEKLSSIGQAPIDKETEASLGFGNRARYAIEPLQSNRKALLVQEYGEDNVMEDKGGNLYIKQDGSFLPVNKEGFSVADVADVAGATPEIAGGVAGMVLGSPALLPGAMAVGAAGGALGSAIRQGTSAVLGTPQIATVGERAAETGLSAAFGGLGSGIGQVVKGIAPQAKQGISQIIKNLSGGAKEVAETTGETALKTVSNSVSEATGKIIPLFNEQTEKSIMNEVADQSGRGVVQGEMKKLQEIAARQGIPGPTYAQAAQGKALIAEAKILDTPLISGKVRKIYDGQLKQIKNNLENLTGKSIDTDADFFELGATTREMAETVLEAGKKASSELYQQVEEEGADAMIGKRALFNKFRDKAGELGLINPDLTRAKHAADTGFTKDTFNTLQDVLFEGIDAIKNTQSEKIRFESANALRRTIKSYAEELRDKNPSAARYVEKFGRELDSTVERILDREAPQLSEKFKAANKGWAKYKTQEETLKKILKNGNLDDEKIVKTLMSGTNNINSMKEIIGEDRVKEVGKAYVHNILKGLKESGIGRASSALKKIEDQSAQIKTAIGDEAFNNLVDNLHFLNRTGQPLSVSRASLYNLLDNRGPGLKSLTLELAGTAKTLAESKGTTLSKSISETATAPIRKSVEKISSNKGAASAANVLTDDSQRMMSFYPGGKSNAIAEREKESQKRKRAISGEK